MSVLDLLATKEPQKVEVALRAAESLIRSQLSDLEEVYKRVIGKGVGQCVLRERPGGGIQKSDREGSRTVFVYRGRDLEEVYKRVIGKGVGQCLCSEGEAWDE